jgi:hypothetical protein
MLLGCLDFESVLSGRAQVVIPVQSPHVDPNVLLWVDVIASISA